MPTGKPRGRPRKNPVSNKNTVSKVKRPAVSRITNTSSLFIDDADMDLDIEHFTPIADKKTIPFRDVMTEMYRDSPVPDMFKGNTPDNEEMQKIINDLENTNQGWFGKRTEKGGKSKKYKNHKLKNKTKKIK